MHHAAARLDRLRVGLLGHLGTGASCALLVCALASHEASAAQNPAAQNPAAQNSAAQNSAAQSLPTDQRPAKPAAKDAAKGAAAKKPLQPAANTPIDTSLPRAREDKTAESIGTGGVVELTAIEPEQPVVRDTTVIPTDIDSAPAIPLAKRADTGKPLMTAAAADKVAQASAATRRQGGSLAAGASESSALMDQVVPTALALAGTIAVIFLARFVVKRFGERLGSGKRPSGVVEVLARYPFARGHHLVLIKVGRRVLVTHQSAQGIQTLTEFTSQAEVADLIARCEAGARGTDQFSFDSLLRSSDREFDAPGLLDRRATQKPQRAETRSASAVAGRPAEIETIDLTRRRGVLR